MAGAAGTTALNAVTYVDMAWRVRGASDAPEKVVEKAAELAGHPVPGEGEARANRLSALGALSGIAVGSGVGALMAVAGSRLPVWFGAAVTGAAAMAATDIPMKRLAVSDPTEWSGSDWLADLAPHLAYGAVTFASLRALQRSATGQV